MKQFIGMLSLALSLSLVSLFVPSTAYGQGEYYAFETAQQEALYNRLTKELRCPKCQNQTISDSDAPLAADMRKKVHEMVLAGDTYEGVISFMKVRYGDFVHYKPPVKASTIVLWLAPIAAILLGALFILVQVRTQRKGDVELTAEEEAQLAKVLGDDTQKGHK